MHLAHLIQNDKFKMVLLFPPKKSTRWTESLVFPSISFYFYQFAITCGVPDGIETTLLGSARIILSCLPLVSKLEQVYDYEKEATCLGY